jgi:histidyl-tRNA synthetase
LRALGLSTEMYPEAAKTAKQFKYAEKRKARFVFYIDQKNDPSKPFILKNMKTSELHECNLESLHETIKLIRSSSTQS